MAEKARFFTSSDGDRLYLAEDFNEVLDWLTESQWGVIESFDDALEVVKGAAEYDTAVPTGVAVKDGAFYANTASLNMTHAAVTTGQQRYDRVVIRLDAASRTIHAVIIAGTAGVSPSEPAVVAATDIKLALVLIDNSTGTPAFTITDEREFRTPVLLEGSSLDLLVTGSTYALTDIAGAAAANGIGDATGATLGAKMLAAIDAVTLAKMANLAEARIIGRQSGGGTGIPEALTGANVRTIINVADGATANAKATAAELNTATDDAKFATAEAIRGSKYGIKIVQIMANSSSALTTGDGKMYFRVPEEMNTWNLIRVAGHCQGASSSGSIEVQIRNVTDSVDMLSTKLTIEAGEYDSKDATTPMVVDATKDDVATGDWIAVDIDGAGTGVTWLLIELAFQKPGA